MSAKPRADGRMGRAWMGGGRRAAGLQRESRLAAGSGGRIPEARGTPRSSSSGPLARVRPARGAPQTCRLSHRLRLTARDARGAWPPAARSLPSTSWVRRARRAPRSSSSGPLAKLRRARGRREAGKGGRRLLPEGAQESVQEGEAAACVEPRAKRGRLAPWGRPQARPWGRGRRGWAKAARRALAAPRRTWNGTAAPAEPPPRASAAGLHRPAANPKTKRRSRPGLGRARRVWAQAALHRRALRGEPEAQALNRAESRRSCALTWRGRAMGASSRRTLTMQKKSRSDAAA